MKNEKYTGTYVYNRIAEKSMNGTTNRHKLKDDVEIIKVDNACPALVSKEVFHKVAERMKDNKRRAPSNTAKEVYLLSGKVVCGECGSVYNGIN